MVGAVEGSVEGAFDRVGVADETVEGITEGEAVRASVGATVGDIVVGRVVDHWQEAVYL